MKKETWKGRGISSSPPSPYDKHTLSSLHTEGIDAPVHETAPRTQLYTGKPKSIINAVRSPDIPIDYSMNPYQGCEHGCVYCYARRSHTYWGFNAGIDFETRIVVKKEAPRLLEKAFLSPRWRPAPIMLSGNTDCYQPLEKKLSLTRDCLKVFLRYRHPVGIITKNALLTRDIDLLSALAEKNLVRVYLSLTTFDESLRRLMEPRTATIGKRLDTIAQLASAGIPTGAMLAPMIVGLNDHEMAALMQASAEHGACTAGYSLLRLDDQSAPLFETWLHTHYPDKAQKIWHKIRELHGGQITDSQFGRRRKGTGTWAKTMADLFAALKRKHFSEKSMPAYDRTHFVVPHKPDLFS